MQGTVKGLKLDRGFFFIHPTDGSRDVFAHCTAVEGLDFDATLNERLVEFEIGVDHKSGKERAVRVRPAT